MATWNRALSREDASRVRERTMARQAQADSDRQSQRDSRRSNNERSFQDQKDEDKAFQRGLREQGIKPGSREYNNQTNQRREQQTEERDARRAKIDANVAKHKENRDKERNKNHWLNETEEGRKYTYNKYNERQAVTNALGEQGLLAGAGQERYNMEQKYAPVMRHVGAGGTDGEGTDAHTSGSQRNSPLYKEYEKDRDAYYERRDADKAAGIDPNNPRSQGGGGTARREARARSQRVSATASREFYGNLGIEGYGDKPWEGHVAPSRRGRGANNGNGSSNNNGNTGGNNNTGVGNNNTGGEQVLRRAGPINGNPNLLNNGGNNSNNNNNSGNNSNNNNNNDNSDNRGNQSGDGSNYDNRGNQSGDNSDYSAGDGGDGAKGGDGGAIDNSNVGNNDAQQSQDWNQDFTVGNNSNVWAPVDSSNNVYGGNTRIFNYTSGGSGGSGGGGGGSNGSGGGGAGASSVDSRFYDNPASMATMGGFYEVDDSASRQASFTNLHQGLNRSNQQRYAGSGAALSNMFSNYDARRYSPENMESTIRNSTQNSYDRADVQTAWTFGDIWNEDYAPTNWTMPKPPKEIKNDDDLGEKEADRVENA